MSQRDERGIYVLCPDYAPASGGLRHLYRHVDVLNAHGFDARIVHQKRPFRCDWFANSTRVEYAEEIEDRATDFLVVPEVYGPRLHEIGMGMKTVIFNQNAYLTFTGYAVDVDDTTTAYRSSEVVACIVVSDDNRDYLQFAFPGIALHRLMYGIDREFFRAGPKKPQICFMPRKHPDEARQVLNILKHRGALAGFSIVPIDGVRESEVARLMSESLVFLSFGYPEGCALPPLEAMASGCVTIGYHGNGCREYLRPPFAYPIGTGDIIGFAKCVEDVLNEWRSQPARLVEMARQAAEFIGKTYTVAREEADIVAIWDRIFESNG